MHCPVCGCVSEEVLRKDGYPILKCRHCGHRFCGHVPPPDHVSTVYSDDYFMGGGAGYSDYLAEADLLVEHGENYGKLLSRYTQPGKVLDVGSAAGFVLKGLQKQGWQGSGLEPNPAMAHYATDQLGITTEIGTLTNYTTSERFRLVTFIQVVAHVYDVRQAFEKAASLTENGGFWLFETWNWQSWMARSLGSNWHEYSPPSVLHWFTPFSLKALAAQFGFHEIARGRPRKFLNGNHAKSLLSYKLGSSRFGQLTRQGLQLIPDHVAIPYPSFDLFWALYQQSPAYDLKLAS